MNHSTHLLAVESWPLLRPPLRGPVLVLFLSHSLGFVGPASVQFQTHPATDQDLANQAFDPSLLSAMAFRLIGRYRRGRSTAVAGFPESPHLLPWDPGGGVLTAAGAGEARENISNGYFDVVSMGVVEVALSGANVIYARIGSAPFPR